MADEWTLATLDQIKSNESGAIAIGPFGSRMKAEVYVPQGVPVIRGNNLGQTKAFVGEFVYVATEFAASLGNSNVYDGDLVFPHRGNIGEVGIVSGGAEAHFVLSTSMMKISLDRTRTEPLFFFYFFRSAQGRHELLKNASQVGTPGIATPLTSLRSIQVPLPPLKEQQAIACILGSLDDKIELNRQMNGMLEAMARAIFKTWFVDFDPVRTKAFVRREHPNWTEEKVSRAACPNMNPEIACLFPDRVKQSELGEAPLGWPSKTLAELARLNPENWSRDTAPERIEYVDLANTKSGRIESTAAYLWKDAPSRAQRVLRPGDTIVGTVRPGNRSYALIFKTGLTGSTGFAVLRPRSPEFEEFVYLAATAPENIDRLAHLADGAAYPAVRPEAVLATAAVRPTDSVMDPEIWTEKRPSLSWWAALKMKGSQCHERARITRPA